MPNKQSLQIQSAESGFKLIGPMMFSLLQIQILQKVQRHVRPGRFFLAACLSFLAYLFVDDSCLVCGSHRGHADSVGLEVVYELFILP